MGKRGPKPIAKKLREIQMRCFKCENEEEKEILLQEFKQLAEKSDGMSKQVQKNVEKQLSFGHIVKTDSKFKKPKQIVSHSFNLLFKWSKEYISWIYG